AHPTGQQLVIEPGDIVRVVQKRVDDHPAALERGEDLLPAPVGQVGGFQVLHGPLPDEDLLRLGSPDLQGPTLKFDLLHHRLVLIGGLLFGHDATVPPDEVTSQPMDTVNPARPATSWSAVARYGRAGRAGWWTWRA